MKFCTKNNCGNVLSSLFKENKLVFYCDSCDTEFESKPEDTLVYDNFLQEDTLYKHEIYLNYAYCDNITELVNLKCKNPKCSETIVRVVNVSKDQKNIYVCPTCKFQFI